jgi:hypothetical protein
MTSQKVLDDMDRQGLRPATLLELLWLGIQHPQLQLEFLIIALGTVVWVDGYHYVASLDWDNELERGLYLYHFDDDWSEKNCRFAAVCK